MWILVGDSPQEQFTSQGLPAQKINSVKTRALVFQNIYSGASAVLGLLLKL
jgi:hypothetical protein